MKLSAPTKPSPLNFFSASTLNLHYTSVFENAPVLSSEDLEAVLCEPIPNNGAPEFCFHSVNSEQVQRAITGSSKCVGVDALSSEMLCLASSTITAHLTDLVNLSLTSANFPAIWKRALLRPLAKSSNIDSPSDTRPIAILSALSKVAERIVHDQLVAHLEKYHLLDPCQAGFRKGHSTQTALIGVLDDVRRGIDKRMLSVLLFFDFSKAFDTVPLPRLLHKLRMMSCSDHVIRWFYHYLSGRQQTVLDDDGNISDWVEVKAGVPQGSVLGPLLFSIFINDLPSVLQHSRHMIYADDTQIFSSFEFGDLLGGIPLMSSDADSVARWAISNGLSLNISKTKVMIIGSELYVSRLNFNSLPRVSVLGVELPYECEIKNLGVWITPTLNWSKHVSVILKRGFSALKTLRSHRLNDVVCLL